MDDVLRRIGRGVAQGGAPTDEAVLLSARFRRGEFEYNQLLLAAAAGIEPANLALGLNRDQANSRIAGLLPAPSRDLFEPIVEQVKFVWGLNQRLGLGFTASDFASLPLPTSWPNDTPHNLTAVTLVHYLDTVGDTYEGFCKAIERFLEMKSDEQHLKLLDGIVHPGKCLRWETIDMAANWGQENGIAPRDVRNPETSPHAGILAAGAIHKKWVEAMDGTTVPYVWAAGYQTRIKPTGPWGLVPYLHDNLCVRRLFLNLFGDGNHDQSSAVPVSRE